MKVSEMPDTPPVVSEALSNALFEEFILPSLSAVNPSANPVAMIFGGQPGAGKTALIGNTATQMGDNEFAQIIGDNYRSFHPHYEALMARDDKTAASLIDHDIARWIERGIVYAAERKISVIIEGTMRRPDKVAATMERFRTLGYVIDARAMAVNFHLSWLSVLLRYETQRRARGFGRMTSAEAHAAAYNGMLETLEYVENHKLADSITVLGRGGELPLYRNTLTDGRFTVPPMARIVTEAERSRKLTEDEKIYYISACETLLALLTRPGRNATDNEMVEAHRIISAIGEM